METTILVRVRGLELIAKELNIWIAAVILWLIVAISILINLP